MSCSELPADILVSRSRPVFHAILGSGPLLPIFLESGGGMNSRLATRSSRLRARPALMVAALTLGSACSSHDLNTPPPPDVNVGSIVVSADSTALVAGTSLQFAAIIHDTLGAAHDTPVAWLSANSSIARVSPSGLVTGVAPGTVVITATAGLVSASVSVTVTASEPLTLSITSPSRRATAYVGAGAPDDVAEVMLTGDASGTTTWTASSRHAWTSLTNPTGSGSGRLKWTRSTTGLTPGTYVDTISVAAAGASGSPVLIFDTLVVAAPPATFTLLISPLSRKVVVPWGDSAPGGSATATVAGATPQSVAVAAFSHKPWDASPVVAGNQVTWPRKVAGLAIGTYVDSITVQANPLSGGTSMVARVYDTLVIAPGPGPLNLSAAPLARAASVQSGTVSVSDSANVALTGKNANSTKWSATSSASWVVLTTPAGIGTGSLAWRRNASSLLPGIYYDTITVSVDGVPSLSRKLYDTLRVVGAQVTEALTMGSTSGWVGTPLSIHSQAFRTRGAGAFLRFGTVTAPLVRSDDTTLSAQIPTTLKAGPVTPVVELDGYSISLASITVYGYAEAQILPLVAAEGLAWPRTGNASLMAQTVNGLSLFDLNARTVNTFNGVGTYNGCMFSPGPTYLDSVFAVCGAGGMVETWRLLPTPIRLAITPYSLSWEAIQMDSVSWLLANKDFVQAPSGSTALFEAAGPVYSPRHDRALFKAFGVNGRFGLPDSPGIPVFSAPSGAVAYFLPQLKWTFAADFSADGEWLAIAGGSGAYPQPADTLTVLMVRASTGEVVASAALPHVGARVLAFDPRRPFVYLGNGGPNGRVVVLDRTTLQPIATMDASEPDPLGRGGGPGVIALDSQNGLYFWPGNGATIVWHFILPQALLQRGR